MKNSLNCEIRRNMNNFKPERKMVSCGNCNQTWKDSDSLEFHQKWNLCKGSGTEEAAKIEISSNKKVSKQMSQNHFKFAIIRFPKIRKTHYSSPKTPRHHHKLGRIYTKYPMGCYQYEM